MSYPVDSGYNDGDLILAQQSLQYAEIVNAFADNSAFFRQDISTTPNSIRLDYSTGNEISALTDGQVVFFRVRSGGSNTSAVQVVIAGPAGDLAPVPLRHSGGAELASGDLQALQIGAAVYNATQAYFELFGSAGGAAVPDMFGDASDGNVTYSTGTSVFARDMYFDTLELTGTAVIRTEGYRLFAKTLILSTAGAGAIRASGANASGATGGVGRPANTVGGSSPGTDGATATTGTGQPAAAPAAVDPGNGGNGGGTRSSGSGTNAGAAIASGTATAHPIDLRFATESLLRGASLIGGGAGGRAGSSGGGDGTNSGGAGGGGGGGGGVLAIFAKTIVTSAATPAGVIRSVGGTGDPGTAPAGAGNCGGGSGGAGGGGGFIYLVYQSRTGPPILNGLRVHGGDGGVGAVGIGTGLAGGGGDGGGAGSIIQISLGNQAVSVTTGNRNSAAGGDAVGNTPGTGGSGRNNQATL